LDLRKESVSPTQQIASVLKQHVPVTNSTIKNPFSSTVLLRIAKKRLEVLFLVSSCSAVFNRIVEYATLQEAFTDADILPFSHPASFSTVMHQSSDRDKVIN
jgi:hypothetical protein